jgi:hypothetical protein
MPWPTSARKHAVPLSPPASATVPSRLRLSRRMAGHHDRDSAACPVHQRVDAPIRGTRQDLGGMGGTGRAHRTTESRRSQRPPASRAPRRWTGRPRQAQQAHRERVATDYLYSADGTLLIRQHTERRRRPLHRRHRTTPARQRHDLGPALLRRRGHQRRSAVQPDRHREVLGRCCGLIPLGPRPHDRRSC